jgi:hypothetical protein
VPRDAGHHRGVVAAEKEGREIDAQLVFLREFAPQVCVGRNAPAGDDGPDAGVAYGPGKPRKKNVYRGLAEARRDVLGRRRRAGALVGWQMVDHRGFQA